MTPYIPNIPDSTKNPNLINEAEASAAPERADVINVMAAITTVGAPIIFTPTAASPIISTPTMPTAAPICFGSRSMASFSISYSTSIIAISTTIGIGTSFTAS